MVPVSVANTQLTQAAHVPSINSLESIYYCLERPIMFAALKGIEMRVGHDKFPLINQNYYSGPE